MHGWLVGWIDGRIGRGGCVDGWMDECRVTG